MTVTIFSTKNPDYFLTQTESNNINTDLLKYAISQSSTPKLADEFDSEEDIYSVIDKLYSFDIDHPYVEWVQDYSPYLLKIKKDTKIPDRGFWKIHKYVSLKREEKEAKPLFELETIERKMPNDYIVIDVETTGLNPKIDEIIQFSAVKYINNKVDSTLDLFIKPSHGAEITQEITAITGISAKDVESQDTFLDNFDKINKFVSGGFLVGHNFKFDLSMIKSEYDRIKKPINSIKYADTLKIARKQMPYLGRGAYKLENLKMKLPETELGQLKSHNSLNDAYITGSLYQYLKKLALE